MKKIKSKTNDQPVSIAYALDEWEAQLLAEREASMITASTYYKVKGWNARKRAFLIERYGKRATLERIVPNDSKMYEIWLKGRRLSHNVVVRRIRHLKRFLTFCTDNEWLIRNPFQGYRAKLEKRKGNYLTEHELRSLQTTPIENESLNRQRDVFAFMCFTGLAYSDIRSLRKTHFLKTNDGQIYIEKARAKNGNLQTIPLFPQAAAILKKYENDADCLASGLLVPVLANAKINEYLKLVAATCGILKPLKTHDARRTFATILYNSGISSKSVTGALGHLSIVTTETSYAFLQPESVIREISEKFNLKQL